MNEEELYNDEEKMTYAELKEFMIDMILSNTRVYHYDLIQEYFDMRFDLYLKEQQIIDKIGFIKCTKCGKIDPIFRFVQRGSFGDSNFLECICGYRWDTFFPEDDMMTQQEYYKQKYTKSST
ncbi:MAG: hypothetical protein P1Q69_06960 [Candidatus Thorarchaeota archaeon]|nr:hypothetical protein [Candidatus Thorarchaeota archaeon]